MNNPKLWFEISSVGDGYVVKTYEIAKRGKYFLEESRVFTSYFGAKALLSFKVRRYLITRI